MTAIAVQAALGRPAADRGQALLAIPENQWFDRKSSRITARELAPHLVAFANAEGGVVVVGLGRRSVDGIDATPQRLNDWQQAAMDFTVPPVRMTASRVACRRTADGEDDHLLVMEVEAGETVHRTVNDEVYLRLGDESRRLRFRERQELLYDRGQAAFEATPVRDADRGELDNNVLRGYANALSHPEPMRLLQARGLVGRDGAMTVGGLLLFGRAPQARYPQAVVRVLRYRGTIRGVGARQRLSDEVRCEGSIPVLLERARNEIHARLPTRQALGVDGRFGAVGILPQDVWLEGVVNAVVHRSYSLSGDYVRVEIFDDRIEIESPGRFPGLVDPTDPKGVARYARNPRIARVCADLRFGQDLGEGIRRMFEEMRLAGLTDPEYVQTSASVRLMLSSTPVDRALEARLPEGGRELTRLVREAERPSTGDLVDATGLSRPVVIKRLKALEALGLVTWVGKSPKDPRAYWRLPV